ncbi:MAG: hypothetical protein QNI84_10025 [Henriciella sp.]|nr:hypothetical protein [Henriciella sp.]
MRISVLFVAFGMLAACGGGEIAESFDTRRNVGACPTAGAIYTASRIVELADETNSFSNITYTGEVVDVRMYCRYAGGDPVSAEIEIDFAFGKGPQGTERTKDYTYWVAVARRSGKVLNKEFFTVRADFDEGDIVGRSELIQNILIPRVDETISAANFEVLVGFDLTEEQLTFNKEGHRFRLNAGQ